MIIVRIGFGSLAQHINGPRPKNKEFVENELENWVLMNQINKPIDLDDKKV